MWLGMGCLVSITPLPGAGMSRPLTKERVVAVKKAPNDFKAATRRMYHNLKRRDKRCKMTLAEFREWVELNQWQVPKQLWRCAYCHDWLNLSGLTIDHYFPLSLGGPTSTDNLAIVCQPCNTRKGQLGGTEFVSLMKLAAGWSPPMQQYLWRKLGSQERWYGVHKKRQAAKAKLLK